MQAVLERMLRSRFAETKMTDDHRSGCPINLSLEVFGDKWSLLIIRDMIFGGKRHFRDILICIEWFW